MGRTIAMSRDPPDPLRVCPIIDGSVGRLVFTPLGAPIWVDINSARGKSLLSLTPLLFAHLPCSSSHFAAMDQLCIPKSDFVLFLKVFPVAYVLAELIRPLFVSFASYARSRWTKVGIISSALKRLKDLDNLIECVKSMHQTSESPAPDHCSREDLDELVYKRDW